VSRDLYFGAPAHLRQERCDRVLAAYRSELRAAELVVATPQRRSIRRDPPPVPAALTPTSDPLLLRVAEEIEYARRMLDSMGDALSNDPAVVGRHAVQLQSFDIIGQMLGHLATIVQSSDPAGAVERIGMAELKARLKRYTL
jgi:hypothetical protein